MGYVFCNSTRSVKLVGLLDGFGLFLGVFVLVYCLYHKEHFGGIHSMHACFVVIECIGWFFG